MIVLCPICVDNLISDGDLLMLAGIAFFLLEILFLVMLSLFHSGVVHLWLSVVPLAVPFDPLLLSTSWRTAKATMGHAFLRPWKGKGMSVPIRVDQYLTFHNGY